MDHNSKLKGRAFIAWLPSGSFSGHFVDEVSKKCFGLMGEDIQYERECSHGEDYRILLTTVIDFKSEKETEILVERRGEDCSVLLSIERIDGENERISNIFRNLKIKNENSGNPYLHFGCETLISGSEAEKQIQKFLPKLCGMNAIVNLGPMELKMSLKDNFDELENVPKGEVKNSSKGEIKSSVSLNSEVLKLEEIMAQKLGVDPKNSEMSISEALKLLVQEELTNEGIIDQNLNFLEGIGEDRNV